MLYKLNVQAYRKESLIIKRKHEASARKTTIMGWIANDGRMTHAKLL